MIWRIIDNTGDQQTHANSEGFRSPKTLGEFQRDYGVIMVYIFYAKSNLDSGLAHYK